VLDHELKSEYQRWLHERDKDHDDYDGHPDRTPDEIREWAYQHDLPYFDDEVHFPDVRIEYQEPDGRWEREDIEVLTPHYRGAHGASVARSGLSCYRGISLSVSGRSGGGKGRGRQGGLAEEPGMNGLELQHLLAEQGHRSCTSAIRHALPRERTHRRRRLQSLERSSRWPLVDKG
jgi:hypothetical protein